MPGIEAGRLRHRITLRTLVVTRDDYGQLIREWSDDATVWAHVSPQRGDESFEAARTDAAETIKVLIRFRTVQTSSRIVWRDAVYDIVSVDESRRDLDQLWIMAVAHDV